MSTRLVRALAAVTCILAASAVPVITGGAEELPPGFTDGRPAGGQAIDGGADGGGAAATGASPAATDRYFGEGPFEAVLAAAAAAPRSCTISDSGLAALVLAPVFKESSAATTPSSAPSPMTLSRYDEWNGVTSDSMGTPENNYGLYAFRNPNTSFKRAFWHPGLGIWQYDTAGLGAPLTTIESMDVREVAADVARVISTRYCAASGTSEQRRLEGWRDWGFPCDLCEEFFQEMVSTTPKFANLHLVEGIGPLGGVVTRSCQLPGVSGSLPCWYVNPSVGTIQGATAWATLPPTDGGSPTVAPTPLSAPFYVVDRGATEERHWLRADTGYSTDIRATRTIGRDARPRSTQSGSGLTWSSSSGLCDITASRGTCFPVPPPAKRVDTFQTTDPFQPLILDLDGSGVDDVLWYGSGSNRDALWLGTASGSFTSATLEVNGIYQPFTGDFNGDGRDDVFWYAPGAAADSIWFGANPHTNRIAVAMPVNGSYHPMVGDFDGNGRDDIFWYASGSPSDSIWYGQSNHTFTKVARPVSGSYVPVVGDLNGTGRDDILWYRAGAVVHPVWYGSTSPGSFTATTVSVSGSHVPFGGDFDGDGRDDVFLYAAGAAADTVLFGAPGTTLSKVPTAVSGAYFPVAADLQGDGRTDIVWYSTTTADSAWMGRSDRGFTAAETSIPFLYLPVVGQLDDGPGDDVLWYASGAQHLDVVWLDP